MLLLNIIYIIYKYIVYVKPFQIVKICSFHRILSLYLHSVIVIMLQYYTRYKTIVLKKRIKGIRFSSRPRSIDFLYQLYFYLHNIIFKTLRQHTTYFVWSIPWVGSSMSVCMCVYNQDLFKVLWVRTYHVYHIVRVKSEARTFFNVYALVCIMWYNISINFLSSISLSLSLSLSSLLLVSWWVWNLTFHDFSAFFRHRSLKRKTTNKKIMRKKMRIRN